MCLYFLACLFDLCYVVNRRRSAQFVVGRCRASFVVLSAMSIDRKKENGAGGYHRDLNHWDVVLMTLVSAL